MKCEDALSHLSHKSHLSAFPPLMLARAQVLAGLLQKNVCGGVGGGGCGGGWVFVMGNVESAVREADMDIYGCAWAYCGCHQQNVEDACQVCGYNMAYTRYNHIISYSSILVRTDISTEEERSSLPSAFTFPHLSCTWSQLRKTAETVQLEPGETTVTVIATHPSSNGGKKGVLPLMLQRKSPWNGSDPLNKQTTLRAL